MTNNILKWEPDNFELELNSVWSFPERGNWATHDSKYRGNWSPYIPRNLILRYSKENDLILDQFTEPGQNCTWCNDFYGQLRDLIFSPDTKADQKSYFAEILAISGRVENVKTLVDAITSAKSQDEADSFAEALELTIGKDDVVKILSVIGGNKTVAAAPRGGEFTLPLPDVGVGNAA